LGSNPTLSANSLAHARSLTARVVFRLRAIRSAHRARHESHCSAAPSPLGWESRASRISRLRCSLRLGSNPTELRQLPRSRSVVGGSGGRLGHRATNLRSSRLGSNPTELRQLPRSRSVVDGSGRLQASRDSLRSPRSARIPPSPPTLSLALRRWRLGSDSRASRSSRLRRSLRLGSNPFSPLNRSSAHSRLLRLWARWRWRTRTNRDPRDPLRRIT
jgi:hypothetical protein